MADWVTIAKSSELPAGTRRLREIHGHRLAIFNIDGRLIAVDNHCSHRQGPVAAGELSATAITCPWHGLKFDLSSGRCLEPGNLPLKMYDVRQQQTEIQVDLDSLAAATSDDASIGQYLVRYGLPGYVGRFGTVHDLELRRGDWVLVVTDRGEEVGKVLAVPSAKNLQVQPAGEVMRGLQPEEVQQYQHQCERNLPIQQTCEALLATKDIPITLIDIETLFDGTTVILYYLGEAKIELGILASELSKTCPVERLQFQAWDLTDGETEDGESEEDETMKGPYERTKYDFRRVWECPECHHRERTAGSVTSCFCQCQETKDSGPGNAMKLVEDGPRRV